MRAPGVMCVRTCGVRVRVCVRECVLARVYACVCEPYARNACVRYRLWVCETRLGRDVDTR